MEDVTNTSEGVSDDFRAEQPMTDDEVTPRQQAMIEDLVSIAEEHGPFNTGTGADGGHYAPADANPFKTEGLMCVNCELYQPISETEGRCAVLEGPLADGHIEPEAICKLWVIPESKLATPSRMEETVSEERRVITAAELRDNPDLVKELRDGTSNIEERRSFDATVEVRELQDGEFQIAGHGSVFESQSEDLGFREIIARGAFRKVLRTNPDVVATFNHSLDMILGRTTSGTLRLSEDATGLAYEIDCAPTSFGLDLQKMMARGDINRSSFAFTVAPEDVTWSEDPDTGELVRTIHNFSGLFDVSVVTRPAYAAADSSLVRSDSSTATSEQDDQGAAAQLVDQADERSRQEDDVVPASLSKAWWISRMRVTGRA